ncbi:MAG: phenylalanine--tRNA ligase subunit beta [Candidatus Bathyarchaeota archaeon]|nr:phenylalanine--tRNA ligase subunit beta [Candidatus Bathyarchaeota archaeon]
MPTITISYEDLINLLGEKLSLKKIEETLFLTKCQVESLTSNEITIEVMADRPDLLSAEGISRELKGILGFEKGLKKYKVGRSNVKINVESTVEIVRPFISSSVIKGVTLNDESVRQVMQLQEKLHLTYCRNRRKVSIGIHDFDTIEGDIFYAGVPPDRIRFVPLDEEEEMNGIEILENIPKGREYGHIIKNFPRYPLLYDSKGDVLSLPPIINGIVTKITENTKNILLDVTGTDPDLVEFVNNIMASNIFERGGKIEAVEISKKDETRFVPKLDSQSIKFRIDFTNEILGLKLNKTQIINSLEKMRYGIKTIGKNYLEVSIPPYRADILHEIDIIEDVALGYGYNRLGPEMPLIPTIGIDREINSYIRKACNIMIGLGFQEVLNYILTNREYLFEKMAIQNSDVVELENPLTSEYSTLRNSLLPGLINFLSYNKHISYPQNIFECGDVVIYNESEPTKTSNSKRLTAALCDYRISYEDIQSSLYSFLKNMGIKKWILERTENPSFIKGRVASIYIEGIKNPMGIIGEINPIILNNFEIENPIATFEIKLEEMMNNLT